MPYTSTYRRSSRRYTTRRRKSKYHPLERLAFGMGRIDKGLKDSNTRVYDSYQAGCNATKRAKKPLY